MSRVAKFHERLVVVVPPRQKAEIIALADRENLSMGAIVRRALQRELEAA